MMDSIMRKRKGDVGQRSTIEKMHQFAQQRAALWKHWAKCARMDLTNLRHKTSSISEANFKCLKHGYLTVHAQMEVDRTVDVALRQERLQHRKSVMRSDRQLRRAALPSASQSSWAGTRCAFKKAWKCGWTTKTGVPGCIAGRDPNPHGPLGVLELFNGCCGRGGCGGCGGRGWVGDLLRALSEGSRVTFFC
jgi:hypothetical protein